MLGHSIESGFEVEIAQQLLRTLSDCSDEAKDNERHESESSLVGWVYRLIDALRFTLFAQCGCNSLSRTSTQCDSFHSTLSRHYYLCVSNDRCGYTYSR